LPLRVVSIFDPVQNDFDFGWRHAHLDELRDGVGCVFCCLMSGAQGTRNGRVMTSLELAHQLEQVFDVAY
jgi:hypothetical protein